MRSLEVLKPQVREAAEFVLLSAEEQGLSLLIYCTLRTAEEQARLYRRGRTIGEIRAMADELMAVWAAPRLGQILLDVGPQYGPKVTDAAPGQSLHNYGLAFDAVPLLDGYPAWENTSFQEGKAWDQYGALVREAGLDWGDAEYGTKRRPHAQARGMQWQDLISTL